ncbi:MAG: glycosyltransferase [Gammaproteobacteria bacterium]|nr:glycosyltransferase [Gammaproteobacteria bacterium]
MKISIITPSYNQERFIGRCITSVRKQVGIFEVEHIILDNCSNDETAQKLQAYQVSPSKIDVRVVIESDAGQTAAINKGFSMATGDVVCWLNTDEWYEDGALAKIVDYFETHSGVDVVFGDCDFVDTTGKLVKRKREYFYSESMLIYYGCFIPSCTTFIRRRVIDDGVFLNPEFKVTMDFDWYVRIAKAGYHFAHLPVTLASFTWHDANISSIFIERRKVERRLVQDRFSGVKGPRWFGTLVYEFMRYFWIGIRVVRRLVG